MYNLVSPIKDITTSILEPVAEQVLRYIISRVGFSDIFGNNLLFNSTHEATSKTTNDQEQRVLIEDKIICDVTNILSPTETPYEGLNTTHITSEGYRLGKISNNYPMFSDIVNKVFLYSLDRPGAIQIEAEFVFKDRTIAYELGNRMFTMFSNGMTVPVIDLMFDYGVPENLLVAMYTLYKLTPWYQTDKVNFVDYLKEGSNAIIDVKVNKLINAHKQIIVQRTLKNCLIKLDFSDPNVNSEKKEKTPIKFNNRMTITVQFSKPSDMILSFPIMINNTLIPYTLIPEYANPPQPPIYIHPEIPINNFIKHVDSCFRDWCMLFWDRYTLENLTDPSRWESTLRDAWTHLKQTNYVRIPSYDNWMPPAEPRIPDSSFYNPIAVIIVTIDDTGILRLHWKNEIQPATKFSDATISYLQEHEDAIFYDGLDFLVAVYRDDVMLDQSMLHNDKTYLIINSKKKNCIHRVVFYSKVGMYKGMMKPAFGVGIFDLVISKEKEK